MVEAGTIIRGKRVDVFQADPPNPAELGIVAELFGDITHGAGGGILRGELGDASATVHLNGEIPERRNDREGTNKLRGSIDCLPAHRLINLLMAGPRSTIRPKAAPRRVTLPVNFRGGALVGRDSVEPRQVYNACCRSSARGLPALAYYFDGSAIFSTILPRVWRDAICLCA